MNAVKWLLVLGLLLMGCARAGRAVPPAAEFAPTPETTPTVAPERGMALSEALLPWVTEQLGVPEATLTLEAAEAVMWPDTSLGCPQPGMMYAEVITPGWRFVFRDSKGMEILVHTDEALQQRVLCEPQPQRATSTTAADQVRDALAAELGVSPETLTLLAANEVEWPDASLGCPQPGMMYAQVVTPGYQYLFADASGKRYDVRTGRNPQHWVVCSMGSDESAREAPGTELIPAVQAAREWLAQQQDVPMTRLTVLTVEDVEWPDSCLGCAEPGTFCLTVIVPGYRVVLTDGNTRFEVRTDRDGKTVAMCKP